MPLIQLKEDYEFKKTGNSKCFVIKSHDIKSNDLHKYKSFKILLQPNGEK